MILSRGKIYQNAKGQKMVKKKMYQKIQTCKRQGLVKAEISRKLELDPRTVAKYYDMSEIDYREYIQNSSNMTLLVILIKPIYIVFSTIQNYSNRKSL